MKLGFSSYLTLIFLQIDIHGEFYGQYFMEDGLGESKKEFCQYYRPNGGKKADQSPKKGRFGKPVKQRGNLVLNLGRNSLGRDKIQSSSGW